MVICSTPHSVAAIATLAALSACSYEATYVDCTIHCTDDTGCPSGLTCGVEHLCRTEEATSPLCVDEHLVLWLIADSLVQLGDGTRVAAWSSKTDGTVAAQQAMAANQPTLHADQLAGHAVVDFTMTPPTYLALVTPRTESEYTIFGVTAGWTPPRLVFLGDGYNPDGSPHAHAYSFFGPGVDTATKVYLRDAGDAGLTEPSSADNGAHVYTGMRTNDGHGSLWVDGASLGDGPVSTTPFSAIGSRTWSGPDQTSMGTIAELRFYNVALDEAERMAVEQDLRITYGTP